MFGFVWVWLLYNTIMTILDGLILGILQGITEFIPVSSSGHLVVAQHFLGVHHSAVFDSLVNLGTFLALVIYFRVRIREIILRIFKERDFRLARNIIISAIPVGLVGIVFKEFFESAMVQNPWVVVTTLIVFGVLMIVLDKLPRASNKTPAELSVPRAGAIGLAQILALIPGVSRSGSTMIAGRLAGLTYAQAAEYSFLLSIPVMAGVVLLGFVGSDGREFIANNFAVWAVSNIAALICGLIAVGFMLKFLARNNLVGFGVYRICLAVVVIATLLFVG